MKMPPTQLEFIAFDGGLDLVTPMLMMPPGRCRDAQNVELDTYGGYRRTDAYERFDGRPSPSDALHYVMPVAFVGTINVGDTIVGGTSAAMGVVIVVNGSRLVFTKATGNFVVGEDVEVSAVPQAVVTGDPMPSGGDSSEQVAQYRNLAADVYRADIAAVPGAGPVRGIKLYAGTLYAFRNSADNSRCDMHKNSPTGWQLVGLGEQIEFTNANVSVGDGDTLTQGGVTATIERVVLESGSLQSGTNTGRLILSARTGGNFAAGAATSTGGGALTLGGVQTAITMPPGGRFRFYEYNFGPGRRLYGCSGVGQAFEFDGTVFAPIRTGMTPDAPEHIAAHRNHLFLAFGNSLQHSAIGDPYAWTPVLGAAELNAGDTVTNLLPMPGDNVAGGALAVFTRNSTVLLYGSSSSDWQLVTLRHDAGALAHTAQTLDTAYCLDDRGVTSMPASDRFGNFEAASISQAIRPWLVARRGRSLDSCIIRDKNQYRILYTGGEVLTMTMRGNKVAGFMPLRLGRSMVLVESAEAPDGTERVFYADNAGMVYESGKGTSFDGDPIEWYAVLAFNHTKSPRLLKQYRKVVFEVGGDGYAQFFFSADLNYGSPETPQIDPRPMDFGVQELGLANWDLGTWDVGFWDGVTLLPAEQSLSGIAQNLAMRVAGTSDFHAALILSGALLHYTPRRLMR
jgi:hypothetical protein